MNLTWEICGNNLRALAVVLLAMLTVLPALLT
jgi:hypothetical protein